MPHGGVLFLDIETSKSAPNLHVFNILTYKCASCHSGVPFFDIPTSTSGPALVCFVHFYLKIFHVSSEHMPPSEPTFRPSRHTSHWKNTAACDFSNILCVCSFFSSDFLTRLCFFLLTLVRLSILSEVWLLNLLSIIISSLAPLDWLSASVTKSVRQLTGLAT